MLCAKDGLEHLWRQCDSATPRSELSAGLSETLDYSLHSTTGARDAAQARSAAGGLAAVTWQVSTAAAITRPHFYAWCAAVPRRARAPPAPATPLQYRLRARGACDRPLPSCGVGIRRPHSPLPALAPPRPAPAGASRAMNLGAVRPTICPAASGAPLRSRGSTHV